MNELNPPNLSPEELAKRLDDILSSENNASLASGLQADSRIQTAIRLANAPHPQMSPDMVSRIHARVIRANRQQRASRKQTQRGRVWRPKYAFTTRLVATFVIVMAFFSASLFPTLATSVPGEFWYPFKRSLEDVELSFASSASTRANIYLTQAERRVKEAQIMLYRQVFDQKLILDANQSLANYEHLTSEVAPSSINTELRAAFVTELIQEVEYQQTVSSRRGIALLPTILPTTVASIPLVAINATTAASNTPTLVMPTDVSPTAVTTDQGIESQVIMTTSASESTDAPPTAVATSTLWPTATRQPPTTTMYALESANVRSQPSRDQTVITVLRQGLSTEIIGEDDSGKWWHVRLKDGTSGWVAKFLLSVDKPVISSGSNGSSGNNGSSGSNDPSGNNDPSNGSNNGNLGCDHPGNYCNAPGQNGTQSSSSNNSNNGSSGNNNSNNNNSNNNNSNNNNSNNNNSNNNNSNSQSPPDNQPNEHSQSNNGNGHKP